MSTAILTKFTPVRKSISHDDVELLAETAVAIDHLKNDLPDTLRDKLARIVASLHEVAGELDVQHGFGIYAAAPDQASALSEVAA